MLALSQRANDCASAENCHDSSSLYTPGSKYILRYIYIYIHIYTHMYIYYIHIYILYSNQVVPGQAGGGSFKFETLKRFSPIERNKDCGSVAIGDRQASCASQQQSLDLSFRCHVF